jgi:hypothetical protein
MRLRLLSAVLGPVASLLSGASMGSDRHPQRAALRRKVARYASGELWALLTAAGASPGVRHRWASVQHIVSYAVRSEKFGGKRVGPDQLEQLLQDCLDDEPRLQTLEDFVPEDPRDVVFVRVGSRLVRLFPGSVERPVADIDRALLVSGAIDDLLVGELGFGVSDVVDVVLGYADAAITILAPSWPTDEFPGEGEVHLSPSEFTAANAVLEMGTPAVLEQDERHRLALEWMTCDADELPYEPSDGQSPFGRFVRVRTKTDNIRWLPLAFLPEILSYAVGRLAAEAAHLPGAQDLFAGAVANDVRTLLWCFSSLIYGPANSDGTPIAVRQNGVQWISMLTPRRALVVQVGSGLRLGDVTDYGTPEALRVSQRTTQQEDNPIVVNMPPGQLTLDSRTEVVPLLIVGSPNHIVVGQLPGLPAMSLDDLRWATLNANARTDLYTYCRDMARPDLPPFFAWEAIDIWEWWRSNGKSFFSGGQPPSLTLVAPHSGSAEWRRAVALSDLERALLRLQLPPLRRLAGIDDRGNGPPSIYTYAVDASDEAEDEEPVRPLHRRPGLSGWTIHLSDIPVAISAVRTDWNEDLVDLLRELSIAFALALGAVEPTWTSVHTGTQVAGYRIELSPKVTDSDKIMHWAGHRIVQALAGTEIHSELAVNVAAMSAAADVDARQVRDQMAVAARELLVSSGVEAGAATVEAAWRASDPTLGVRLVRHLTIRNDLLPPVNLDDALVSQVDRKVAEAVKTAAVHPGDYTGTEAKAVDRDVLAPAALSTLNDALAGHRMDDLVLFGMRQIERTISHYTRALQGVSNSVPLLPVGTDPLSRFRQTESEYLELRRCGEVAVEAALRLAPTGATPVDEIAWGEILAAAYAYLRATNRSEGIHHQLSPTLLRITESWEISTEPDESGIAADNAAGHGLVYRFDSNAFGRAVAAERLAADASAPLQTTVSAVETSSETVDSANSDTALVSSHQPLMTGQADQELSGETIDPDLDAAMRDAYGASGTDLVSTLLALAAWPLTDEDNDAVAVTRDAVTAHVLASVNLGDDLDRAARVEATLDLLISNSADLAAEDWRPWLARSRKRRLLVQPLPVLSDTRLVVSPHLCFGSASLYRRYLEQGQLPWTQPRPPRTVEEALEKVRDDRNTALEHQVVAVLRQNGWSVIDRIKPNKAARLSVPVLRTEIDAVAARPGHRVIWLLEAKDPADAVVIPEIRRALDRFFVDNERHAGYVTQLGVKYEDLAPYAAEVAHALGLPDRGRDDPYVIRPLFVTRAPVPAAFVPGPFPFTSMAGLVAAVSDTDKALAWLPATADDSSNTTH